MRRVLCDVEAPIPRLRYGARANHVMRTAALNLHTPDSMRSAAAMGAIVAALAANLVSASPGNGQSITPQRSDETQTDPLILRLDALGISDGDSSNTDDATSGFQEHARSDIELHLISDPPGYGLLAARTLETGVGAERGLCRAPCDTWIDPGSYRLVVENRRGRNRAVPGVVSLTHDGQLELHIESRRLIRVAWWSASLALIGGGLTLFIDQRQPVPTNDPYCEVSCFRHTSRQRTLMTLGGITAMFGGITMRYGLTARDYGRVVFRPGLSGALRPRDD